MYLISLIYKVILIKKRDLLVYILNSILLVVSYRLLLNSNEIFYPLALSTFILIFYIGFEVYHFSKFFCSLEEASKSPNYEHDTLNAGDKLVFETINSIHESYISKFYKLKTSYDSRNTLFSQWIHNMKTSITVIDLAYNKYSEKNDEIDECLKDIIFENNKLKNNLEESLNLLRIDDFSRDYVPEKIDLMELVTSAVNSKKRDFIYNEVYPKLNIPKQLKVYTDKKWCGYMLEQIISNAIKYSYKNKSEKIYISAASTAEKTILSIRDEGIGIKSEDLSRVFNPFFTGSNGRYDKNATGIGLYMVKVICEKLGHVVEISSQEGKGTEVTLSFVTKM